MSRLFCFYLFIYLWLCWVFVSMRGLSLVAASRGHSSLWCAGLSPSRPLLLRGTGSRRAGSVVVAHGPSCSAACGIFPDRGSNPCPLHWQADSQPLRHQGNPSSIFLLIPKFSRTCVPASRELFSALLPLPGLEDHCLILMLWPKVLQVSLLSPALEQALHTCALGGFRGDVPALPLPPSEVDCHHLPLCVRPRAPEGFPGSPALPSDFSRPLHLS